MQETLSKFTGRKSLHDFFKDHVRQFVPELQNRNDFVVEYKMNSLTCPKCGVENASGGFFYKMNDSEEWIYSGDDIWPCDRCRTEATFEEYQRTSEEQRKFDIAKRTEQEYYSVPDTLRFAGFKNYQALDNVTARAKEQAIQYTKDFINGERYTLLMQGSPGTGKSHLSVAIARTIKAKDPSLSVGFITVGELLRMIKETYKKGASKSEKDIFEDLKRMDLLILDDLGAESTGNDNWRLSMLFEIVNSRLGQPTIYTSNLTDDLLPTAIGERVYSRLLDNTKFIDLFTDDYRKRLKRA